MNVLKLLPIILGGAAVMQAVLNKTIAGTNGLSTACLINGFVVAVCAAIFFLLVYWFPDYFPEIIHIRKTEQTFQWWYLIPGLIGFSLILVIPLVITEVGALSVFLGIIAGQIIVSLVWDARFENIPVNGIRLAGAMMTFVGALLVAWKK